MSEHRSSGSGVTTEVLVALGSNLGDRMAHLRQGVEALAEVMTITDVSSVVESRAQGLPEGDEAPDFLNAVVRGRTDLGPGELLEVCHGAEADAGRPRNRPTESRTLDLDLLFYGDRVSRGSGVRLPHPRWKERGFVLRPLLEVAPEWVDPVTGESVRSICNRRARLLSGVRVVGSGSDLRA
ncbi:MAG: 2-amino-4-hydroxy-6-hydroxymethyldihydropteridine diphosphokinase [Longimicrobiales bacterium]|nr:2-amino-4-hydroxy-6-hydroxymethyldihydropteridine diphosphokinase [Longimicrobiales bacterium]